jgi:hypothetical protein
MGCFKQQRIPLIRTLNHVMMVQKEKKKRKHWTPPKGKGKKKIYVEPLSSKPKTKGKSAPSPDEECFHCYKKGY